MTLSVKRERDRKIVMELGRETVMAVFLQSEWKYDFDSQIGIHCKLYYGKDVVAMYLFNNNNMWLTKTIFKQWDNPKFYESDIRIMLREIVQNYFRLDAEIVPNINAFGEYD